MLNWRRKPGTTVLPHAAGIVRVGVPMGAACAGLEQAKAGERGTPPTRPPAPAPAPAHVT